MRISKVTTKIGDKGNTLLGDGKRVTKSHPWVRTLGEVDELNAQIGCVIVVSTNDIISTELKKIQNDLFNLGGELAISDLSTTLLSNKRVEEMDKQIKIMNAKLPPLKEFMLPGGDEFSSRLHLARTVCRRVEREVVQLAEVESTRPYWIQYLNRLSDYLFVMVRYYNYLQKIEEEVWDRG